MVEPTSAALPAGDGARGIGDGGATSPAPAPPAPVLVRPAQYPKNAPLVEIGTTFEVVDDATGATIEVRRTGLLTFHCSMDGCVAKFEVHTKNLASMKTHARSKHKPSGTPSGGGGAAAGSTGRTEGETFTVLVEFDGVGDEDISAEFEFTVAQLADGSGLLGSQLINSPAQGRSGTT